jgi:hypothetical protein
LPRLKDAALRIDQRDTLTAEYKSWFQINRGQMIVNFAEPPNLREAYVTERATLLSLRDAELPPEMPPKEYAPARPGCRLFQRG